MVSCVFDRVSLLGVLIFRVFLRGCPGCLPCVSPLLFICCRRYLTMSPCVPTKMTGALALPSTEVCRKIESSQKRRKTRCSCRCVSVTGSKSHCMLNTTGYSPEKVCVCVCVCFFFVGYIGVCVCVFASVRMCAFVCVCLCVSCVCHVCVTFSCLCLRV